LRAELRREIRVGHLIDERFQLRLSLLPSWLLFEEAAFQKLGDLLVEQHLGRFLGGNDVVNVLQQTHGSLLIYTHSRSPQIVNLAITEPAGAGGVLARPNDYGKGRAACGASQRSKGAP